MSAQDSTAAASAAQPEADRLSAAFGIYRLVFQAQKSLRTLETSPRSSPRGSSPLFESPPHAHARSSSLVAPGENESANASRFRRATSIHHTKRKDQAHSPPSSPFTSSPIPAEPIRSRAVSSLTSALKPFRTLRRKLVGSKRALESLQPDNALTKSPTSSLEDIAKTTSSMSTTSLDPEQPPRQSPRQPPPPPIPIPMKNKADGSSWRQISWVEKRNKVQIDYIRSGYLYSQLYSTKGPTDQARTFFVTLTADRISLCLSDAANAQPIASSLLTELNDTQIAEIALGDDPSTTLREKTCTLYSHTLPFCVFSGPGAEIEQWHAAISKAMKDSFDRLISAAVPKVSSSDHHRRASSLKDQYHIQGNKGIGAAAFVKNAVNRESGRPVIVKFVNKALSEVGPDGLPTEVTTLLSTKHANIVEVKEVYETEDYFIIVMDKFGEGSDLFDYIQSAERIPEDEARNIFAQVTNAVSHLAQNNIVHGDIKDQNIIIDGQTGNIKLIDFGSNKRFTSHDNFDTYTGTFQMACPEAVSNQPFNPMRQELWSLGVLLYILLTGDYPFETAEDIREGNVKRIPDDVLLQVSEDSLDLIERLLQPDPALQMTLEQLLAHRWLASSREV